MQNQVWKLPLNRTFYFQTDCSVISVILNTQRGVGTHLPAMLCAMGLLGRPVFGNGLDYPTYNNYLFLPGTCSIRSCTHWQVLLYPHLKNPLYCAWQNVQYLCFSTNSKRACQNVQYLCFSTNSKWGMVDGALQSDLPACRADSCTCLPL
jgi:hypothetical protein